MIPTLCNSRWFSITSSIFFATLCGCSSGSSSMVSGAGSDAGSEGGTALRKFVGEVIEKSSSSDYAGQLIDVINDNGSLSVQLMGEEGKVRVSMKPVAFAGKDAKADADGMHEQVRSTFSITETASKITIRCGIGSDAVGSSQPSLSGCEGLSVYVPSRRTSPGIALKALTRNGSFQSPALIAAEGALLDIRAENGSVNVGLTGGAKIASGNGDVKVDAVPTKGSTLTVESKNGDIDLALQSDFAADVIELSAGKGVEVSGFDDLTKDSTSRGTKGTGAANITAKAGSLGKLTVTPR